MPFLWARMAKPDDVVEMVFVDDESTVESGGADAGADPLLVPFFFAILLKRVKFFRVNRARFSSCSPSLSSSLSICRFRTRVAGGTCSCPSTFGSEREVSRHFRGLDCGCCLAVCTISSVSRWLVSGNVSIPCPLVLLPRLRVVVRPFASIGGIYRVQLSRYFSCLLLECFLLALR